MKCAMSKGLFSGFDCGHSSIFSHLQYADDTLLVGNASFGNMWVIKAVL